MNQQGIWQAASSFTYDSGISVEAWIGRFRKDYGHNPHVTFFEKVRENVVTVCGDTESTRTRRFDLPVANNPRRNGPTIDVHKKSCSS
jgi:hypothetical protein